MSVPEFLAYDFMQRAFVAGALVGLLCSVIGVFVVLRGLAFIGAGISHAAFAGVALGLLSGLSPILTSFIFCSVVALLVGYGSRTANIREDTSIGILFAASMALGVILLSLAPNGNMDLVAYLFGSILTISSRDLAIVVIMAVFVLICVYAFYKEFVTLLFDEELAAISGMPHKALSYLLLILVSLSIIASMKLTGIILVSSLIVTPAAAALQLVRDFDRALLVSAVIGVASTELGLVTSFYLNSPPGATIVMVLTLIFLLSAAYRNILRAS